SWRNGANGAEGLAQGEGLAVSPPHALTVAMRPRAFPGRIEEERSQVGLVHWTRGSPVDVAAALTDDPEFIFALVPTGDGLGPYLPPTLKSESAVWIGSASTLPTHAKLPSGRILPTWLLSQVSVF